MWDIKYIGQPQTSGLYNSSSGKVPCSCQVLNIYNNDQLNTNHSAIVHSTDDNYIALHGFLFFLLEEGGGGRDTVVGEH